MGNFVVKIDAVGGHGCQRDVKDGQITHGCGKMGCPDCEARRFVRTLKNSGVDVKAATVTHWPDEPSQVQDDLLSGKRTGSF